MIVHCLSIRSASTRFVSDVLQATDKTLSLRVFFFCYWDAIIMLVHHSEIISIWLSKNMDVFKWIDYKIKSITEDLGIEAPSDVPQVCQEVAAFLKEFRLRMLKYARMPGCIGASEFTPTWKIPVQCQVLKIKDLSLHNPVFIYFYFADIDNFLHLKTHGDPNFFCLCFIFCQPPNYSPQRMTLINIYSNLTFINLDTKSIF